MKLLSALTAPALLLSLAAPAFAGDYEVYEDVLPENRDPEGALYFSQMDLDRNGVLTRSEIVAAFGDGAFDAIMAFDANADWQLTRNEMRAYGDLGTGGPAGLLHESVRG
ncbi:MULTISPECIES: hypothetical protein [Roseobacteraceae]|uniref:hypothetical protein n=1 Tax=Roseobacteraceae TaxID=2854170 RepID=UPI0013B93E67|nr:MULTISPECIES: hypothetical protein [Roseobacteraceae]MCA0998343.1 hypothetical protein [Alloyangia pacifica]NDW00627.1 hypothetical protein [Salipiger sp. PrR002]NDW57778.1 hypothetical protein [Salipiger sp. PrR004]